MFAMIENLKSPWPWYFAGAIIGLIVPLLLIIGNKTFGLSSNLRHICAACFPANIKFFKYNWKNEIWNLFFVAGIIIGAFIAAHYLSNPNAIVINEKLKLINAKKILILVENIDSNLALASRNIPYIEIIEASNLNPVLLVGSDKVIATPGALKQLEDRLS